jgi:hypothetical protein
LKRTIDIRSAEALWDAGSALIRRDSDREMLPPNHCPTLKSNRRLSQETTDGDTQNYDDPA